MLTEVCANIRNYFTYEGDKHFGDFAVIDGLITPSFDIPTDYIRIVGSHKNDGVHKLSDTNLVDEDKFHGAIWVMSPPADFLALVAEMEEWQKKFGALDSQAMSPYNSESFGGYSYSKSSGGSSSGGATSTVTDAIAAFAGRLNTYRRIRV